MHLSFLIAWRYIISKKKTNAINIISAISIMGLSIGTAALILVLSVFNGLGDLISGMFGAFNPDLIISPKVGKHFVYDETMLDEIRNTEGVIAVSAVLEELALFENDKVQAFGRIKGVDSAFSEVSNIGSYLYSGSLTFKDGTIEKSVVGLGIADRLGVNIYDDYAVVKAYAPKRNRKGPMDKPFNMRAMQPSGIFAIQQDYDNEYILSSLGFAQELLELPGRISGIEVKLSPQSEGESIRQLRNKFEVDFVLKDRRQQDEAFLKLQNLEKWISYIILSLTLVLVAFNLVGAIWMILREKMLDISVLKALGYGDQQVASIFKYMGLLLGLIGVGSGTLLALFIYYLQITFALVKIPDGFAVSAYPVALSFMDILVVGLTVLTISTLSALPAAYRAKKISMNLRDQ